MIDNITLYALNSYLCSVLCRPEGLQPFETEDMDLCVFGVFIYCLFSKPGHQNAAGSGHVKMAVRETKTETLPL